MSIEFETDQIPQFKARTSMGIGGLPSDPKGLSGWLIKRGIIRTESQASAFLVLIVIMNFVLTGIVIYFFIL